MQGELLGTILTTAYHSKYWAAALTVKSPADSIDNLSRSIANARVDLNPHQVDAALFALRSPLSKGVILADEVGLGKTIEAALVIAQRWAERRRNILLIVPATLRKQWQQELDEKFFLPSVVLDSRAHSLAVKQGHLQPFHQRRDRRRADGLHGLDGVRQPARVRGPDVEDRQQVRHELRARS